jgi:hypothetical protein
MKKQPPNGNVTMMTCRHCAGSGLQFDDIETGKKMRAMRLAKGITLAKMSTLMKPELTAAYLCDLEYGKRHWSVEKVNRYKEICL